MRTSFLAVTIGALLAIALASCSSAKPCSATCTGCCDAANACQLGGNALACGIGGELCHSCSIGLVCLGGTCSSLGSGGGFSNGGGSGVGGGAATGGGSATGGGTGSGGGSATGGGGSATGGGSANGGGSGTGGGGTGNKPNVMMVIDRSGSMLEPMNPANTNCPSGCGASVACPANCPTRWSELGAGLDTFLSANAQSARFGAIFFPLGSVCNAPGFADITDGGVDLPAQGVVDSTTLLATQASDVSNAVTATLPGGGTPTAATIELFTTYAPLADSSRHDWVVLLTDGVPNCNANNPNTCADANACQCTVLSGGCTMADGLCQLGCLDADATAAAEISLRQKGIKTVVIGLGTEVTMGSGPATLTTMGTAGGYVRTCPFGTNTECAPGTCNTSNNTCSVNYFAISSQTELAQALQTVSTTF